MEERDTESNDSSQQPLRSTASVSPTPTKKRKYVQKNAENVLDLVAKRMEAPQNSECDVFGAYVAKKLENLKTTTPTMYPLVKKLINDAIFEAEMGKLSPYSRIDLNHRAPSPCRSPLLIPSVEIKCEDLNLP